MSVKSRGLTLRTVEKVMTEEEWWDNFFKQQGNKLLKRERNEANLKNKSERAAWAAMRTEAHAAENAEKQRRLALLATTPKGAMPTSSKPSTKPTGGARTRRRSRKSKGTRR